MPLFDKDTLGKLLGSIEANNLAAICGAGLSIPAPSRLLSAGQVAQICYDKWYPTQVLPPALRTDIEQLAGHFFDTAQFESVFINRLVPWDELVGESNGGHGAFADFLICKAVCSVVTANFDPLIERWAGGRKIAMRGALDGVQASKQHPSHNPLLKFHGCFSIAPEETIWTKKQFGDAKVAARLKSCADWMKLNLASKDLLIVGFWTDWDYLNDLIEDIAALTGLGHIVVVDRLSDAELQAKAPALWAGLNAAGSSFKHIQASGDTALDELRVAFSKVWATKFYRLGKASIEAEGKAYPVAVETRALSSSELYELRLDGEGVPYNRAAKNKAPPQESALAALCHLLLVNAAATPTRAWHELKGQTIRVVHGAGQILSEMREKYEEAPAGGQPDIVVCAGAHEVNVPGRIKASGSGASVVRPARGGTAKWLTFEQARAELAI